MVSLDEAWCTISYRWKIVSYALWVQAICAVGPRASICLLMAFNNNPKKEETVDYFDIVLVQTLNIYHNSAIQCGGLHSDEYLFEVFCKFTNILMCYDGVDGYPK